MAQLDWDLFLERVEGKEALALELAQDLVLCIDSYLDNLEYAITEAYPKPIERSAHALRGLVAPYGGHDLLNILKSIEEEARRGEPASSEIPLDIRVMVQELKAEVSDKLVHAQHRTLPSFRPEQTH